MCGRKSGSGFTLIELLVVITIIAILAAILFPVFLNAKRAGQAKACYGNIKTFGNAMLLYADEYHGYMVPCIQHEYDTDPPDYPDRKSGRLLLYPYIRSRKAYMCPAMIRDAATWYTDSDITHDIPSSYGLNQEVTSNDSDPQLRHLHRISEYPRPTQIIALGEVKGGIWTCDFKMALRQNIPLYAPFYHFGRMNVAFVDGHVKSVYLYDTLGTTPLEWMWWDPAVNTDCGNRGDPTYWQQKFRKEWLRSYPPFGSKM